MTSAKQSPTPHPSRTVPIPDTLESIKGYPDKLKIYLMAASSFWQVRFFDGKSTIKRSTGQTDKREAIKSAISFYEKLLINKHNGVAIVKNTRFDACASSFMQAQAARVMRKEMSAECHRNDQYFLDGKVLPDFRELNIAEINYEHLQKFVDKIGVDLSGSSIQRYLGLIRKIFDHAQNRDLLKSIPKFPKIPKHDEPRGWFNFKEYDKLLARANELIGHEDVIRAAPKAGQEQGSVVRSIKFTAELPRMIEFIANSFIRPTDIKNMQHKHVEVIRDDNIYLRLSLPESKKHSDPVVTMERAVNVYEELTADRASARQARPDDYVFMPEHQNRDTALRRLQQQFNYLLDDLGFKAGSRGEIYSLRHTCIMHRLLEGDKIDVLTLARNARTSVEMIERFYASKLNGEMNIEAIQSKREKSKGLKIGNSSKANVQLQVHGNSLVMNLPVAKNAPLNLG
ncbi:hypothetical protein [Rugamonas sp.]|uniref:hypothetical protein n=1 Tax=Rugamonas sp. TaxID=1926287 RepID=UPI0025ED7910|nr:hypothetical protein [Rugamonas sp.]